MGKRDSDNSNRRKKGSFSPAELSVSDKYVYPASRKKMILSGLLISFILIIYFFANQFFLDNSFISRGELTSAHADFKSDCKACHDPTNAVTDKKCATCHEKFGDELGVHSFETHYLYKSSDFSRINESIKEHGDNEQTCYSCHPEHKGRTAMVTVVPDNKCLDCHNYGSFNENHPEFQFARENIPDDSAINFTHIRHTDFVSKALAKKGEKANIESTCLTCHNPQADGKNFKPINYDEHCSDCHLAATTETPLYNIATANSSKPGVLTIDMIRKRVSPGTRWAFYTNPNEFTIIGSGKKLKKSPVYHKDPWILENLKHIRATLFPDLGLEGLLYTSDNSQNKNIKDKYEKYVSVLEDYAAQLRGRPEKEIQAELLVIDSLIRSSKKLIKNKSLFMSAEFSSQPPTPNPNLTPDYVKALNQLAEKLTAANKKLCQECHLLSNASLVSYDGDQKILSRANFDHRAHILESQCLDCHTAIPITQQMSKGEVVKISADLSKIQNIPGIENCQDCHTPKKATNNCVSCHNFHPAKDNRGNLKLYVD